MSETVRAKVQRMAWDPKEPGRRHCGNRQGKLLGSERPRMEELLRKRVLGWGVACLDLYFQAWRQQNAGVGVALLMVGGMMAEGLSLVLLSAPAGGNSMPAASRRDLAVP